jgi:hypothetical protein
LHSLGEQHREDRDHAARPFHDQILARADAASLMSREKKQRSGLQSACDELIDKGAIITGE